MTTTDREAEVRERLGRVTDPELDEPVTELGFVTGVEIDRAGNVEVGFRLPTYWCAANFAFMMADDMRREVSRLPWVTGVGVVLGEHMYAEQINAGMRRGASFEETFGDDTSGDLAALRRTFLVKAFQRRQEALLRHLLDAGMDAERLTGLSLDALQALPLFGTGEFLRWRYLERRDICAPEHETLAFVDADGRAIVATELPAYLRALNRVGVNAEFNGALCRGLLAARFGEAVIERHDEPTLHDFIREAAGHGRGS